MATTKTVSEQEFVSEKAAIEEKLSDFFGVTPLEASIEQIYKAVSMHIVDILMDKKKKFNHKVYAQNAKRVYYLCMEFLVGRSLKTNLFNLGLISTYTKIMESYHIDMDTLYSQEPDAGLGNGGLGRLAACYMDSLASLDYPAYGFCLRYEYGLFKQKIIDGWQTELPDVWLPGGECWLVPRSDRVLKVHFGGWISEHYSNNHLKVDYHDDKVIEAMPYDLLISGGGSEAITTLRLWKARNAQSFDMKSFSQGDYMKSMQENAEAELITKVLYPSDDHSQGKTLRLKQQYFLVSASIQNIINDHLKRHHDLHTLPDFAAIHINDTHPALAIPEMMRLLMDEHEFGWDEAWDIVTKCVAYTNHTVMAEALEQWNEDLVLRLLPRIHQIIQEINRRFMSVLYQKYPMDYGKYAQMTLESDNHIRMANLCVHASFSVNGVSSLHSDIIKDSIFHDFYLETPDKFTNVTNGIAHRRWLDQSNPRLASLLDETIGHEWYHDASALKKFLAYKEDEKVLDALQKIKYENKCDFAKILYKKQGILIDPNTRFDVQVKRLHAYKRQLLNVLKIVYLYTLLEQNPNLEITPQTFIFGAKAAPGYYHAKEVIELINYLMKDLQEHPAIREKLNVVFMEDYCVTLAEHLMPASEVSEQISLAGKEASGTSNMKFMINGAVTLGTMDGANVEIHDSVGEDNIFIFGMSAREVEELWQKGYNSTLYYNSNPKIKTVLDRLKKGFAGKSFTNIVNYLLTEFGIADQYMCLADFDSYLATYQKMDKSYENKKKWNQMSLVNISEAGRFAADRAIEEYATRIWHLKKVK
jgi:starch phosphorylase